jgi:hypothetical protein
MYPGYKGTAFLLILKNSLFPIRHFSSDTEVIAAPENPLDGQNYEFFSGLQTLEQLAKKCI